MTCPNCDTNMEFDEEQGVWYCPDCEYVDDCH